MVCNLVLLVKADKTLDQVYMFSSAVWTISYVQCSRTILIDICQFIYKLL